MTSIAAKMRARNEALYARAIKGLTRKENGGFDDDELLEAMARLLREDIDPERMSRQRAKDVLRNLAEVPGVDNDEPGGLQLNLFGDQYGYNPLRLIKDGMGSTIEEANATLDFMLADMARSADHARRTATWSSRKANQTQYFQIWVMEQRRAGRAEAKLTWGNCVQETGILRPGR